MGRTWRRFPFPLAVGGVGAILLASGCGNGSSDTGTSLNFRAVWEQPGTGSAAGSPADSGFGTELPAAVQTVRILFESEAGPRCCVAVDPDAAPTDPESGQRSLLMKPLPEGPGMVTVSGFPTFFAPAEEGITDTCPTRPAGVGQPCSLVQSQAPSFGSDPVDVLLLPGVDTDAGDIKVFALPFLIDESLRPVRNTAVTNPIPVGFTVASALFEIDPASIEVDTVQEATGVRTIDVELRPCDDAGKDPCSPQRQLDVIGFHITAIETQSLIPGIGRVRVHALNQADPPRELSFGWQFFVED